MAEELKLRKLLQDNDAGLIPRLRRALTHEQYRDRFQLGREEPKISFELGNPTSKIETRIGLQNKVSVTQPVVLKVELEVDVFDELELKILSAQLQAAVDLQISSWHEYNSSVNQIRLLGDVEGLIKYSLASVVPLDRPSSFEAFLETERRFKVLYEEMDR